MKQNYWPTGAQLSGRWNVNSLCFDMKVIQGDIIHYLGVTHELPIWHASSYSIKTLHCIYCMYIILRLYPGDNCSKNPHINPHLRSLLLLPWAKEVKWVAMGWAEFNFWRRQEFSFLLPLPYQILYLHRLLCNVKNLHNTNKCTI